MQTKSLDDTFIDKFCDFKKCNKQAVIAWTFNICSTSEVVNLCTTHYYTALKSSNPADILNLLKDY
jgi:hypothetical protein